MLQEILVMVIIAAAVVWVGVRLLRKLGAQTSDPCNGCGSSCGSCAVYDLKREIEEKKAEKKKKVEEGEQR